MAPHTLGCGLKSGNMFGRTHVGRVLTPSFSNISFESIITIFFTVIYLFTRSLKNSFSLVGKDTKKIWSGWALMLDSLKKAVTYY